MGMFNRVDHPPEPCPKCGEPITEWQTKCDALKPLEVITVKPRDVSYFYGYCDGREHHGSVECRCSGSIKYRAKKAKFSKHKKTERISR